MGMDLYYEVLFVFIVLFLFILLYIGFDWFGVLLIGFCIFVMFFMVKYKGLFDVKVLEFFGGRVFVFLLLIIVEFNEENLWILCYDLELRVGFNY